MIDFSKEPEKDRIQKTLTETFLLMLFLRCDNTPEEVAYSFQRTYQPFLDYLGDKVQDDMLRTAMREVPGVDFSSWITTEEKN